MEKHFLEHYYTDTKKEAMQAAKRKELRTGDEGVFADKTKRIEAYMERLEEIFLNKDTDIRKTNIDLLKPIIYKNTLIKKENFPESYFEYQKQQAIDKGISNYSITQEQKDEEIDKVIESQRLSLDSWIDYLTGDECKYPVEVKYFAIQGVLNLGVFDAENYSFSKRDKKTTAPFVEIDREALSKVLGALEAKKSKKDVSSYSKELLTSIDEHKSFGSMYAETMRELDELANKEEMLPIVDGQWKVFERGSDPKILVDSLEGKRSNLCIADIGSATRYLENGSVEIYFSNNKDNQPTIPRIAIALNENKVSEVRGTYNKNEDFDSFISQTDILFQRLKDVSNGEQYLIADNCMKEMTALYNKCFRIDKKTKEKTYLNPELSKSELIFLYEIDSTIEGFGYERDSRITELREQRKNNLDQDVLVVFGCSKDQIAHNSKEIDENTKAYVGKLEDGFFYKLPESIEYIYTSFPEDRLIKFEALMGDKTKEEIINEIDQRKNSEGDDKILTSSSADFVLKHQYFKVLEKPEIIKYIRLKVKDLGFTSNATTEEIFNKAKKLGLELCPAETGPRLRLDYKKFFQKDQPKNDNFAIGMNPIIDSAGCPMVFNVDRGEGGMVWLDDFDARSDSSDDWSLDSYFVFRVSSRKLES